ncbi:MAG: hypothetical protein ACI3XI_07560 [Eubacteriales bacterium]
MAKTQLTCTFYIGGKQVDKLTPEQTKKMADRIGESMSLYYSRHPEEYKKIKT